MQCVGALFVTNPYYTLLQTNIFRNVLLLFKFAIFDDSISEICQSEIFYFIKNSKTYCQNQQHLTPGENVRQIRKCKSAN